MRRVGWSGGQCLCVTQNEKECGGGKQASKVGRKRCDGFRKSELRAFEKNLSSSLDPE